MRRRTGFTLIELLSAIAIGVLCVAALYFALNTQIRFMDEGNRSVQEAQLARNLMDRIATDVRMSMAILPKYVRRSRSDTSGTGEGEETPSEETPPPADDPASSNSNQYNLGVRGNAAQLYLYISAAPRLDSFQDQGLFPELMPPDVRRVGYWYDPNLGLAREELRTPGYLGWDGGNGTFTILAPPEEVSELSFRYYHHESKDFVYSWDGTKNGPPLMIEITLVTHPPSLTGERSLRGVRQVMVVQVPGAHPPAKQAQRSRSSSSTQPAPPQ